MRKTLHFFAISAFLLLQGCDTTREETNNAGSYAASEEEEEEEEQEEVGTYSLALSRLVKTDTGVFRGVTFNTPINMVKVMEDALELQEETDTFVDYLLNYNFPESAEIIYFRDKNGEVASIEVVIYPSGSDAQNQLFDELISFYNSRYEEGQKDAQGNMKWENSLDNVVVKLSKKNTSKVHDINLIFQPMIPDQQGQAQ